MPIDEAPLKLYLTATGPIASGKTRAIHTAVEALAKDFHVTDMHTITTLRREDTTITLKLRDPA